VALKSLIDQGLVAADPGQRVMALREHFLALFGVGAALGLFSAARFYMVSWLGERITADLRNAVYAHVVRQSPEFFETTQTGEVLSRLTTDTTLVQTVVGSSLSMGLRNTVMGTGRAGHADRHQPLRDDARCWASWCWWCCPACTSAAACASSAAPARTAWPTASAIAAEVLNAIPVVQSYTRRARGRALRRRHRRAFDTARKRTRVRAMLVGFIITATFGALLWGLYQGTQAVLRGDITPATWGRRWST
jgi:ATP-binding cassette subfamily B protein